MISSRVWAVIPAGGVGSRMRAGVPKQYMQLGHTPVIRHTLDRLAHCPSIHSVVVGIAHDDEYWSSLDYQHPKLAAAVDAGKERVDTVENCLQFIVNQGGEEAWALVHDAARPCVRATEIEQLIGVAKNEGRGGILAVPVSDTIKLGSEGKVHRILETVPRDALWRAMTPQMFKVGELLAAIQWARSAGVEITDEASAMEAAGAQPLLLACSPDNIKITLPQDIQFAEMILRAQEQEQERDE